MMLFSALLCTALGEWTQPNYYDALVAAKARSTGWGHPVGIRAAAMWDQCPELAKPDGVAEIQCDQSTCMSVCEDGKATSGKRRTKCRWKRKKGFFWKKQLAPCVGCDPETPVAAAGMTFTCEFNAKRMSKCTARCDNGGTVLGKNKFVVKCKCPRSAGGAERVCGWHNGKSLAPAEFIAGLTCAVADDTATDTDADKPTDDTTGDDKPTGDGTTDDNKPTDDTTGDDKPTDDTTGDDNTGGDQPAGDNTGGDQPATGDDQPANNNRQKILALHGGGGSSASLAGQQGMQDLVAALSTEFEFVFGDAPDGGLWMRDPPSKDEPTNDAAWADTALNYIDQMIADQGPFYGLLGYSQGSAFIPVYLSNRPNQSFNRVMLYCGYLPDTHQGLIATLNANSPLTTPAMVFSGENDTNFAPLAPAQAAVFSNAVTQHSSVAGHELPEADDTTFNSILEFIRAGVTA